jgi:hypothetical protein
MRCREAESWISSRIDGEAIPHGALDGLEMHLAACSGCCRFLRDEEERARALGAHLAAGDTRPLARAVMAAVRAGEAESLPERLPGSRFRGGAPFLRPLAVVAAAFLVVGALVFFDLDPGNPPANDVLETAPLPKLIYVEEVVPSPEDSPLEKETYERRQIILEPGGGSSRPVPEDSGPKHYMQYQKFTDYRYY